MARWQGGTRDRLQGAALDLFARHGYAATTTSEIAEAAGVTQRTFFRHFADKEEVLFGADEELLAAVLDGARSAEPAADPALVVRAALRGLADVLQPAHAELRVRAAVLETDAALVGRDLAKQARWIAALAAGLEGRGVDPERAGALAGAGAAAFRAAYSRWLADRPGPDLAARVDRALTGVGRDLQGLPCG